MANFLLYKAQVFTYFSYIIIYYKLYNMNLDLVTNMYAGKPFQDEGNMVFIPCPVDRLINAFSIAERELFQKPLSISPKEWGEFLKCTLDFIVTIPLDLFTEKVKNLDQGARSLLLRNLDQVFEIDSENILEPYYRAFTE